MQFKIRSLVFVFVLILMVETGFAQRSVIEQSSQSFHFLAQLRGLIENDFLRRDLEIADSQVEDLEKVLKAWKVEKDLFFRSPPPPPIPPDATKEEKLAGVAEHLRHLRQESEIDDLALNQVTDILLPHQVKRLRQIALQAQVHNFRDGFSGFLDAPIKLQNELGLSDVAKLKEKISATQEKYQEDYLSLRQDSFDEVVELLTPRQQKQLKELVGDLYDFEYNKRLKSHDTSVTNSGEMGTLFGDLPEFRETMKQFKGLAANASIKSELEIVDLQIDKLENVFGKWESENERLQGMFADDVDESSAEDRKKIQDKNRAVLDQMREHNASTYKKVSEILLPHQLSRLKQIGLQQRLRIASIAELLLEAPIRLNAQLEISEQQLKDLEPKIEKAKKSFVKEHAAMKQKAFDEVVGMLESEQQEKLKELVGDVFDFEEKERVDTRNLLDQLLKQWEEAQKK